MSSRAALLGAVLIAAACGDRSTAVAAPKSALSVEATDTRGVIAWIAKQHGKPVLVNFWATWCAPCLAELPDLLTATRAFREQGGVVLGVAMEQMGVDSTVDAAVAKAKAKAEQLGLDFEQLVCTDDEMIVVREVLGVELGALPQTLTYGRDGKLVEQHEGIADAAQFTAMAERAAK